MNTASMNIPAYFTSLSDYRVAGRCLHQSGDISGLVLCGTIADCDDLSETEDYGKDNTDFLREQLGFEFANGIPAEDTLNRLVRRLKAKELEGCLKSCLQALTLAGKHLSIDGKELRGTPSLRAVNTPWCRW